ncbi:MAG: carbohydrate ABC transporter permease, partial [Blastomonas sp.]|nr:carbohydrate ABC transporter permease [Blastomonas sp.]
RLGLASSWLGMFLIYTAICTPFPLLVLRNAFAALPKDMDEAARIEGASEWQIFTQIILPNAKSSLVALLLLQFTFIWNDLLFSSVLGNSDNVRSIMVALQTLQGTYSANGPNVVMAGTLIASLPTLALFIVLRRHFMSGLDLAR